jgi:hypothetical protein
MTEQMKAAITRAFYSAFVAAAGAAASAAAAGVQGIQILWIGLAAALAVLGTRGIGEGAFDSKRQRQGRVLPSDIKGQ